LSMAPPPLADATELLPLPPETRFLILTNTATASSILC
jgi:hypothetical protein